MATIKSFTSLEQSKKLAEILPLESADMSWVPCDDGRQKYYQAENRKIVLNYEKNHWFPCWSLAALLGVLPNPKLHQVIGGHWQCECWKNPKDVKNNESTYIGYTKADNPVDACFEMILWIQEFKML